MLGSEVGLADGCGKGIEVGRGVGVEVVGCWVGRDEGRGMGMDVGR